MKIITNNKLINRNARIGQFTSLAGLVILIGGMVLTFQQEEDPRWVFFSLGALLLGFALSQVGIYLGNRYARPPRVDLAMDAALKGTDRYHTIYHFIAPVDHLLVGPSGIWVLVPRQQAGKITFEKGKYRQKGGFRLNYMKLFAQESIGRPDLEVGADLNTIKRYLEKEIPDVQFPPPQAAILFTNEKAEVDADNAPIPAMPVKNFKSFLRKQAKNKEIRMSPEQVEALNNALRARVPDQQEENDEDEE